jgi:uncharacterized membrane protein
MQLSSAKRLGGAPDRDGGGEQIMTFCAKCGAALSEGVAFCGSCGAPVGAAAGGATPSPTPAGPPAPTAATGLEPNVAGALAYVTVIPAIIFLVVEPYNRDKFIRFHSFQSIFLAIAWVALAIVLMIVSAVLAVIPVIGWILGLLLWMALMIGMLVLWVFVVYKAYKNERYMIPVIGKFAAQQAG